MVLEDNTFPQSGDPDDSVRFAQLIGQANILDHVEDGLAVTPDFAAGKADISAGVCFISVESNTATSDSQEIHGLGYAVQVAADSVPLFAGENHIAVVPAYAENDTNAVESYTSLIDVPDSALRIAVVDTNTETVELYNQQPAADFESVTVRDNIRVNGGEELLATENWVSDSIADAAYADTDAVSAIDSEISVAAATVAGLDSAVNLNVSNIGSLESDVSNLQSNKLDSVDYTPTVAVDGEVSVAADSVSGLDTEVSSNNTDISGLDADKLDSVDYTPIVAVDGEVSIAATSVSGLDAQVDANIGDIGALQSNKFDVVDYNPEEDTHNRYADSEAISAVKSSVDISSLLGGAGTSDQIIATDGTSLRYTSVDALRTDPPVDSVFGRTGSVTASSGDYSHSQLSGVSSNDHHAKYTDSEALSVVDAEISLAALSLSGLDSQVSANESDISSLQTDKFDSVDYTPENDTHDKYTDVEATSAADGEVSSAALSLSGLDSQVDANITDIASLESDKLDITGGTLSGSLTLSDGSTSASKNWVNSNADVPNADYADEAGNADTVDGQNASEFASASHTHSQYYRPTGNDKFVINTVTSDPTDPEVGQMWLVREEEEEIIFN